MFCSLDESTLVAERHIQSVDFGQSVSTDFTENRIVYDSHRPIPSSRGTSNVFHILSWIIEHIVFNCHVSPSKSTHFCMSLLFSERLESLVACQRRLPKSFHHQISLLFFILFYQ